MDRADTPTTIEQKARCEGAESDSNGWNIWFVEIPALFQQQKGGGRSLRAHLCLCVSRRFDGPEPELEPDRDASASSSPHWTRPDQRRVIGVKTCWGF
jgi:hypothetical protein